jgi:hypothetical protein
LRAVGLVALTPTGVSPSDPAASCRVDGGEYKLRGSKTKRPRRSGALSQADPVVELDARHALLDKGALRHRMNSEVLR